MDSKSKGVLHIVPTPIGNLEDMSLRAIKILKEADFILSEDTRTTGILLKHFEIQGRLFSYHKFNEHKSHEAVVERILRGENAALVSDAGTPGISDPGFLLVRACVEKGIKVITLPGANACIPAVVSSGLPCDRFCFEGFLPHKKGRLSQIENLTKESRTMIFYEAPTRLVKTLSQFAEAFGEERQCCVSREISKIHEEHVRGSLAEVLAHFQQTPPKGELVITVAGAPSSKKSVHKNKYREGHEENEGQHGERE